MKKSLLQLVILASAACAMATSPLPVDLKINSKGSFNIDSIYFTLGHLGATWKGSSQLSLKPDEGYPKRTAGSFMLLGEFPITGAANSFKVNEQIVSTGPTAFGYSAELTADPAIATKSLYLEIKIPAGDPNIGLYINSEEIQLPEQQVKSVILARAPAKQVLISLANRQIRISGDFYGRVQDNRQYGNDSFSLWLMPRNTDSSVANWNLKADFELLKPLTGAKLPADLKIDNAGNISIGSTKLNWVHYAPGWSGTTLTSGKFKLDNGYPHRSIEQFEVSGDWAGFKMQTSVIAAPNGGVNYSSHLTANPAVECATLALQMDVPVSEIRSVKIDGKIFKFPAELDKMHIFPSKTVNSLEFTADGKIIVFSGTFGLMIQDNRKWAPNFSFRIYPTPYAGRISDSTLQLNIKIELPRTAMLNLRPALNMEFSDAQKNNNELGLDGSRFDGLHMIKPGKINLLGVDFKIASSKENNEKSCIILFEKKKLQPKAEIMIDSTLNSFRYLYLLHTSICNLSEESPIGEIRVEYEDGSERKFPVVSGRDGGNWQEPQSCANGAIAWTGENKESFVGLYFSQFEIGATSKKITFIPAKDSGAVWMIVGATLGDKKIDLTEIIETPSYIVDGKEWLPLEYTGNTSKGSVLDFSRYADAPAGKYGPVIVSQDGHFTFRDAPRKRIRFFGPNLVGNSNYLEKKWADDFVTKAVRLGYNSVRMHHFEYDLLDRHSPDSATLNPQTLDQLDYLFAALKKQGIYSCLDLYASRPLRPGDNIKELEGQDFKNVGFAMKVLIPISQSAMDNWKKFTKNLLTHKNPYTGLTWAEDPALYSVNLVNENSLPFIWNNFPFLVPIYEAKYYAYLKEKGMDTPENRKNRDGLFVQFLNELQIKCIQEQKRFLREELHFVAQITDVNYFCKFTMIDARRQLDFVDSHMYWDHPKFPKQAWRLPYLFANTSAIEQKAFIPRYVMPARIFGKPFTVTEFNFCNPNVYRVEAAPLIGGYAGLQDWDGLYRFAWSHNRGSMMKMGTPNGFDIVNDPQAQMAERIIFMLFMREDVASAKPAFAFCATPEQIRALHGTSQSIGTYPDEFTEIGLYARIGSLGAGDSLAGIQKVFPLTDNWIETLSDNIRPVLANLGIQGTISSATGEIALDSKKKILKIITPRSEVMTFFDNIDGKTMKLKNADRYQTVALMSLDGESLSESSSMLLVQLPNLAASKMKFSNARRKQLEHWGELPLLLEKSKVEVELTLPYEMKVEALKSDGTPNGEITAAYTDGKLKFTADTAAKQGGVMVYHLTR